MDSKVFIVLLLFGLSLVLQAIAGYYRNKILQMHTDEIAMLMRKVNELETELNLERLGKND